MLATPAAGNIGDRFGYLRVAAGVSALGVVGLGLITIAQGILQVAVGVIAFAAALGSFWPVMNAHLMGLFPQDSRGGDLGAMRTVHMAVGSFGPAYVGFVAENASYTVAFASLAVCPLTAGVLTLWLARRGA